MAVRLCTRTWLLAFFPLFFLHHLSLPLQLLLADGAGRGGPVSVIVSPHTARGTSIPASAIRHVFSVCVCLPLGLCLWNVGVRLGVRGYRVRPCDRYLSPDHRQYLFN